MVGFAGLALVCGAVVGGSPIQAKANVAGPSGVCTAADRERLDETAGAWWAKHHQDHNAQSPGVPPRPEAADASDGDGPRVADTDGDRRAAQPPVGRETQAPGSPSVEDATSATAVAQEAEAEAQRAAAEAQRVAEAAAAAQAAAAEEAAQRAHAEAAAAQAAADQAAAAQNSPTTSVAASPLTGQAFRDAVREFLNTLPGGVFIDIEWGNPQGHLGGVWMPGSSYMILNTARLDGRMELTQDVVRHELAHVHQNWTFDAVPISFSRYEAVVDPIFGGAGIERGADAVAYMLGASHLNYQQSFTDRQLSAGRAILDNVVP